ncbi:MAG: hypothetical protein KBT29_10335 [Prevotellaceae bacterium]|nr:hypothetical protein [Candidatus Minthosoma caballi]
MNSDEIDKIIADAVADSKKQSSHKWHKKGTDKVMIARKVLNWSFMLLFAAAIVIYFILPEQKALFFGIGFGAVFLKLIEFYLRFMF